MCVEASIEVNNSAPSSPFEAIFGPEGRSLILGPEGHRTSSFGRTKNVRAEVSSTQLHISTQLASAQDTSPNLGFPLSLTFDHEFFSRAAWGPRGYLILIIDRFCLILDSFGDSFFYSFPLRAGVFFDL